MTRRQPFAILVFALIGASAAMTPNRARGAARNSKVYPFLTKHWGPLDVTERSQP